MKIRVMERDWYLEGGIWEWGELGGDACGARQNLQNFFLGCEFNFDRESYELKTWADQG